MKPLQYIPGHYWEGKIDGEFLEVLIPAKTADESSVIKKGLGMLLDIVQPEERNFFFIRLKLRIPGNATEEAWIRLSSKDIFALSYGAIISVTQRFSTYP